MNRIESYIKGTYEMPEHGVIERMSDRLKESINEPLSWIDLLFTSDIHIIGLGLSFEETDLWWVLNKRARMKWAGDNIINRIFYYPTQNLSNDIRQMLQQFDVEIVEPKRYGLPYMDVYNEQLGRIQAYCSKAEKV